MSHELILETINITKNYFGDKSTGVNNITIQVPKGKITAIVGESGSGKTTLLKLLSGETKPDGGEVYYKGNLLPLRSQGIKPEHTTIAMVSQDNREMNLKHTVWDSVCDGLHSEDQNYRVQKATQALNLLGIYDLKEQPFGKLSGGEKQRVTIARALINKPEVLMLDEPFNQVDASYREDLQHDMRQIVKEWGITVLLVSHDPAEILSMADELIVIKEGEIVEHGTPEKLYNTPRLLYTANILVACTELSAEEAAVCGIKSKRATVVIYAEDIEIGGVGLRKKWMVKQVLFKGFYEELVIEKDEVTLRVFSYVRGKYKAGDKVAIRIAKYLEFGKWLS
ncbi:ABC transporter ATP-binding protein [Mucilaginibacter terrenus]|uniref:ABC transporter ATP-binding protein n=1 Tax=Mucilaginibacter terrenus TaxID=2482727 RepID=A0A3E2NMF2_9SPHI|nr:ABC transporter ATP-binding protein [Mucilaginibacter terrenus]RFZ82187.1 ABC transporter ATP-binding protein [Mucilaginibacter terrenus]